MNHPHRPTHPRAFSQIDALMITVIVAVALGILYFLLGPSNHRRPRNQMRNSSVIRGIHQSMVIFAQNNNTYLPGLSNIGVPLPPNDPVFSSAPGNTLSGASMSARYYILLNGSFIAGDFMISERDILPKWTSSTALPTVNQFSYSLLRIGDSASATTFGNQAERVAEWRDNANSQALLICDRNIAPTADSSAVRSVWSTSSGSAADWKGSGLWGDNHAEFLNATNARLGILSLSTKYGKTINSDDFLFSSDASSTSAGGKSPTASAMFGYTSQDF